MSISLGSATAQDNPNPPVLLFAGALDAVQPGPQGTSAGAGSIARNAIASGSQSLELALPDGDSVTLLRDGFERRGAGNVTWRGHSETEADSRAVLTLNRGFVSGRIRIGLEVYEIRPDQGPRHIIERLDPALFAPETSIPVDIAPEFEPGGGESEPDAGGPSASADPADQLHILVTYTPQARSGAGGTAQIESQIQNAIDGTNTAFIDSNMVPRLVLVHSEELTYNDSGNITDDLYWLQADPGVGSLRDQYGADLVAHIAEDGGAYCGVGFVQRNPGSGFAAWAFSVTDRGCISNLSFAHEVGHNMGFEHNTENSSANASTASYPWSFGYWDSVASFRTVMSYSNPCPGCPRQDNFSNPDIYYSGAPMGVDNEEDNARTGDLTAPIVADFRAAVTPPPPGGPVKFAVIGDFGDDSTAEQDVATMVASQLPDFVTTAGDNRYGILTFDQTVGGHYCDFLANVPVGTNCSGGNSATNAFFPSLGNHDYNDGGGITEYLNYFHLPGDGIPTSGTSGVEHYYDYVQGPVHFFVIDSDAARSSSASMTAQQNWLQTQMGNSTSPWQVVYFHHAPYSSSSNHGSDTAMQWPFESWGADAVIAGHDHTYERLAVGGIPYFVNGLGGRSIYGFAASPLPESQVRYNGDYGAMIVDATDTSMTFQFLNTASTVIDTYTIPDTNTPPSFTSNPVVETDATEGSAYSSTLSDNATDPDGDSLTFTKLSGPAWLSVAPGGALSGTPLSGDVGPNSWQVEVSDGNGGTDTATLEIEVVEPPAFIDHTAIGSTATWGSVSGGISNTHDADTSVQSITEARSGGKPSNRYSRARFDWIFDVTAGDTVMLFANAWATNLGDGDQFELSYSTGGGYTPMFAIDGSFDDNVYQTFALPPSTAGTVYIRVEDTDSTPGNLAYDTVSVDHLFIRTQYSGSGNPPPAPENLVATAMSSSVIDVGWADMASDEMGFYVERSDNGGASWSNIGATPPNTTSFQDNGLAPNTTYHYRARAYNANGNSPYSNEDNATTPSGPAPTYIHIGDLDGSTSGKKRWTAIVDAQVLDSDLNPVENATVLGSWSTGGTANCVTDSAGWCTVEKNHKNSDASATFMVTNVTHASGVYDPTANTDPDGDSDGTVITVFKP